MAGFAELKVWFDQLPEGERKHFEDLRKKAENIGERVLPYNHGNDIWNQLEAAKKRFLACKDPFSLVRIGDCEIGLLGAGVIPVQHDLATQFRFAGLSRESLHLRPDFIKAVRETELLGLQQNWSEIGRKTGTLLFMLGIQVPPENGIEVHLPYKLLVDGTLFQYLAKKKVLLVGAGARRLADCFSIKGFLDAYGFLGPLQDLKITGVIETRTREAGGAWADYERVTLEAGKVDFDVALLACGGMAKPLAWRISKGLKRTALDVGFVFDALMGNEERRHRPILKEVLWPKFP